QLHHTRWPTASRPSRPAGKRLEISLKTGVRFRHPRFFCPPSNRDYSGLKRSVSARATTKRNDANDRLTGWDAAGYEIVGPAFQATLDMLEWRKLCEQVARFASTHAGKRACRALHVPEDPRETLRLLEQTRAITVLEYDWATSLDYGGIQTSEAESGLSRAAKGGMLSAEQLRAIVTLVNGADKLRKQVVVAARDNDSLRPDSAVRVLLAAVGQLRQQPLLVRSVMMAIDEEANVQDSASEQLRGLRARVKAIQSRLAALLKGYGGEVSDRGGRMCVAVPAGTKISNGVLLGSSPGGSLQFVEPPAAMGLNNELGAARAEAQAAEEAVLWQLTGLVLGSLEELESTFRIVAWLDVLSARARYGMWIQGVLPEIVPWDTVFHARGGAAMRRRAREDDGTAGEEGGYSDVNLLRDPEERYAVRLRGLRHPLLYGEYLTEKESLERLVRMNPTPATPSGVSPSLPPSSGTAGGGGGASRRRLLSTRKEVMLRKAGSGSESRSGSGSDSEFEGADVDSPQAALSALRPPRPIDWLTRPDTSVVVITGPNTGGKTAAMKALGLAACMAKAGLPLPAEAPARLPAFSAVLADIGDEQSLTANLSTFSGHLKRIQALRAEADGKALLLLDELGTGTDPLEGAALGVALLKKLVNGGVGSGALTVATTHHSVMTGLKFDDPRFENASVEFDEVALAPTYKLLWGIPGRSNALNIAERLGLDASVVSAARGRLDSGVETVNSAIEQLEGLRGQLEVEERATWGADREVRTLTRKLKAMHTAVEALHERLTRARAEALLQVYTLARDRIRQVKESRKRLGRAAPPPKPLLAQPADFAQPDDTTALLANAAASSTGAWDGNAATASASANAAQPDARIPTEEEIWEAWEAATRSRTKGAGPVVGISAQAIGGPRNAAGTAVPVPPPPPPPPSQPPPSAVGGLPAATPAAASASATSSSAAEAHPVDPLRSLMDLSGDLSEGTLGLEALVDDLVAQERQAVMGQALRQQRDEALYDAALVALDDILDVAAKSPATEQQQQQQPQSQRRLPKSGRARTAGLAMAAVEQGRAKEGGEDDADLAALMAILEEGEAALNARLRQLAAGNDTGGGNPSGSSSAGAGGGSGSGDGSLEPSGQVQQGEAAAGPLRSSSTSSSSSGGSRSSNSDSDSSSSSSVGANGGGTRVQVAGGDDDLDSELGDLDALVEEYTWALHSGDQQQGQRQRQPQDQGHGTARVLSAAYAKVTDVVPGTEGGPRGSVRHVAAHASGQVGFSGRANGERLGTKVEAEAEAEAAVGFLADLLEGLEGREVVATGIGVGPSVAAGAATATVTATTNSSEPGSSRSAVRDATASGGRSGMSSGGKGEKRLQGLAGATQGSGKSPSQRQPQVPPPPPQHQHQNQNQEQQRQRRGKRNW
ncbi:hypothetical protein Vretifemale_18815, partial [Volvox reticuliferus]